MTTKGYNYMRSLVFGQAMYIATERGYVLQNASMVVLYGLYAKSHLYLGFEVLFLPPLVPCKHVGEEFILIRLVGVAICHMSHHLSMVVLSAKCKSLLDAAFMVRLEKVVRRHV